MVRYTIMRCFVAVGLIYLVVSLVFAFLHAIPGDPAELLLTHEGGVAPSREAVSALREQLHLNEPLSTQYVDYLGRLAHFNLGNSFEDGRLVSLDVAQRLPRTIELIIVATFLSLLSGIPLGIFAAGRRGGVLDAAVSALASIGIAVPVFVLGTFLVWLFALELRWVPAGGYVEFAVDPVTHLKELLLPAVSIAFAFVAVIARMTRSSVLEVRNQDWVRTARANGLPPLRVMRRHVLRNALAPIVTVVGLQMGSLLGGTVLVEYVFNWPGISSLLVQAAGQRDYPEVQGIVLVVSTLFILLNLVVDLTYSWLDPRVRYA